MPDEPSLSPKEFLRQRRPERFSDTRRTTEPRLPRTVLDYHLSTLTSRSQENDFQNFAHHLAEKTICPNLRPQTGPAGGGDSKADAETIPVDERLAAAWLVGEAKEAANERWAFAISSKKQWKGKIESDVKKIADTDRGYKRVYCISSQYIRDKDRAKLEDDLKKEHGLDRVVILDRNWILNEVYKHKLEEQAIIDLRMEVGPQPDIQIGPRDALRREALTKTEAEISQLLADGTGDSRLVWCAIESARLSRELELPRTEIDARYQRAIALADSRGSVRQKIEARYQLAWATFWWHEDFTVFVDLYTEVENVVKNSSNIAEVKLLHNLWHLLLRVRQNEDVAREKLKWNERAVTLSDALNRIAQAEDAPSAAVEARALLLFQQAAVTLPHIAPDVFTQFKAVLEQGEGLLGFPLKQTISLIAELGDFIDGNEALDELNEASAVILERYEGEAAKAAQLTRRGFQKLDHGHDYDAIELAGRSLVLLFKNEKQDELIKVLYILALAYERIGLRWAARGALINAAAIMATNWHQHHDPDALRASCFGQLKWTELLFGRLPDSLTWYMLELGTRSIQGRTPSPSAAEERTSYSMILGVYFLHAGLPTLQKLEGLPDALEANDLAEAAGALLWALGWTDHVTEALPPGEDAAAMFLRFRDQRAARDLPPEMQLGYGTGVELASNILGCAVKVSAQNAPPSRILGESLLAAFESALATAFRDKMIPLLPLIEISIRVVEATAFPFKAEIVEGANKVTCAVECAQFDPNRLSREEQWQMKQEMFRLILDIVGHSFTTPDEASFRRIFVENGGMDRAMAFTGGFVSLGNVLGYAPRTQISDWYRDGDEVYNLKRTKRWDEGLRPPERDEPSAGADQPPVHAGADVDHRKIKTLSIINLRLWQQAKFSGTTFIWDQAGEGLPVFGLGFEDETAAAQIFAGWRELVGKVDKTDLIRVVVIKGILKKNPAAYRVSISANPNQSDNSQRVLLTSFQSATMELTDGKHLGLFLEHFNQKKRYWLSFSKVGDLTARPTNETVIGKTNLVVREAWSIKIGEMDMMALHNDDDPFIPEGLEDAPVLAALAHIRELAARGQTEEER